jgi:hypothetical protein
VRAVCHLPPHVYLPPIVGGRVAPNLFCALVGPSGVGKGGSEAAGRDAIEYGRFSEAERLSPEAAEQLLGRGLAELPLGSGEGIARTFSGDSDLHTALFTAPEVDSLSALFSRQGSTLEGEIRKLYMGDTLGFTNANKTTRTYVERLSYRAGVIVGVQPLRSHTLLNGADGGTPQRFLWMPVLDRDRPVERPDTPDPITVFIPDYLPGELPVTELAWEAIDANQRAIHAEDPAVDPLGNHALLTRLKVAVALMVLDGSQNKGARKEVSDEDWNLAGIVMSVSNLSRERCRRAIAEQSRTANTARALAVAEREEIIADRKAQRAQLAITRRLERHPQQTKNQLRMGLKADIRDHLDSALSDLLDRREICLSAGRFSRPEGHMSQGHVPANIPLNSDNDKCPSGTYVPTPLDLARHRQPRQRQRSRGKFRTDQQTEDASA